MGKMTTIIVPKELRDTIKALADSENKSQWRIVQEAISFKYTEKKNPTIKTNLSHADKISWYLCKVLMSIGELKASPTKENLNRLEKTLIQVADRLKLPHNNVNLLLRIARDYVSSDENIRKQIRSEINSVAKMVAIDIMGSDIQTEEE